LLCGDLLNNSSFLILTLFWGNFKLYLFFKTGIFQQVSLLMSRFDPCKIKSNTKKSELTKRASLIGFNKRPNVNIFNNKLSCTDKFKFLYRFESGLTSSKKDYRPNTIALEHINSGNPTTSEVINSVLLNQNISITQKELDELLSLPKVNFDLPVTDQTYPALPLPPSHRT
jgi:hypothetical protein